MSQRRRSARWLGSAVLMDVRTTSGKEPWAWRGGIGDSSRKSREHASQRAYTIFYSTTVTPTDSDPYTYRDCTCQTSPACRSPMLPQKTLHAQPSSHQESWRHCPRQQETPPWTPFMTPWHLLAMTFSLPTPKTWNLHRSLPPMVSSIPALSSDLTCHGRASSKTCCRASKMSEI
jgi:hypothetical protein